MENQREEEARKGARGVWQIHYHIVFPVKYRKLLLDEELTTIIQETATEIADRFLIEKDKPRHGHWMATIHLFTCELQAIILNLPTCIAHLSPSFPLLALPASRQGFYLASS